MKRKKVLYVHHSGRLGGAPKSLKLLLDEIDTDVYEPVVLALKNGPAVGLLESAGVKVIVKPWMFPFHGSTVTGMTLTHFIKNYLFAIPTFFGALIFIRKTKPDLVHLNSTCLFIFALASKCIAKDTTVITHVREPLLQNLWGDILRIGNYKYTDGYVSICENDESRMKLEGKPSKVIYNFINFEHYNSSVKSDVLRKELGYQNGEIICLCLSRVAISNGIIEIIERFNALDTSFAEFKLVIVGLKQNNAYEKKCIDKASTNTNITLLPFRQDITNIIASSDIMLCSFTESHFSRAIIEAAAMGKPSLGNDIGGVNELIVDGKTGYLFDINSQTSLERGLLKLKDSNERLDIGNKAASFARENFDAKRNAKATYDFYNQFFDD